MNDNLCKICGGKEIKVVYELKDYFFTNEDFVINQCEKCGFLFTGGIKSIENIGDYYKTDRYLSHSKNNKSFISKIYNIVKTYSLSRKFLLVSKESSGNKILEIGCATGDLLNIFKKASWNTIGVEPNFEAAAFAKNEYGLSVFNSLNEVNDSDFDVIMLWHVLEHIENFDEIIAIIKSKLKSKGKAIIALPNPDSWDANYYKKHWAGWDVPRHLYHFKKTNIVDVLNKSSFNMYKTVPLPFDSFYISLLSEEHKGVKSTLLKYIKVVVFGFWSNLKAMVSGNYSSLIYIAKPK